MVVDAELNISAVNRAEAAEKLFIGNIHSNDSFRLEIAAAANRSNKVETFRERIAAFHTASYAQIGENIFQCKSSS